MNSNGTSDENRCLIFILPVNLIIYIYFSQGCINSPSSLSNVFSFIVPSTSLPGQQSAKDAEIAQLKQMLAAAKIENFAGVNMRNLTTRRDHAKTDLNRRFATIAQAIHSQDKTEVKIHALAMNDAIKDFQTSSKKLLDFLPMAEMVAVMKENETILEAYYKKKVEVDTFEEDQAKKAKIEEVASVKSHVNLPEIKFPDFNGNPAEWSCWWSMFEELIHKDNYTDGIKFIYLRQFTKGDARRTVESFLAGGAKYYEPCIEELKRYYGRPEAIRNIHLTALENLPKTKDCFEDMRRLLNKVQYHTRSLNEFGCLDMYEYNICLAVLKAMPEEVVRNCDLYPGKKLTKVITALDILVHNLHVDAIRSGYYLNKK